MADALFDGVKLDVGVQARDGGLCFIDLGFADLRFAVKHLPLQVRQRQHVVVNNANRADPRRCQILDRRTANPASTDQ